MRTPHQKEEITMLKEIIGLEGTTVGILTEIKASFIPDDGGRKEKHRLKCSYTGKFRAPTVYAYNNRKPCRPSELIGEKVIIKWSKSKNSKGFESLFIFVLHYSDIRNGKENKLRFLMLDEKDVGAGASIKYHPTKTFIDETFSSQGGNHWERFLLTNDQKVVGVRVTATRNHHNTYEIEV